MAEATGVNGIVVQPEELKFALTWAEGERPSSSAKLTNPTALPVAFAVPATDPDNYEVKPSRGIVPPFGDCRINFTARGLPPVEHREGEISVLTFDALEKYYPLGHHAPDHAITCPAMCERVIRLRWVDPEIEIPLLMNKAAYDVSEQNIGLALETLGEAIKLHRDGYSLLSRALVNHWLGQEGGAKIDLREAERLFSISEGTREHPASRAASSRVYCIISDSIEVPTYTTEKLCGKQMIVKRSVAVTEDQRLDVEVRFTPSIMSEGNVELNVIVESLRFEVVRRSQTTDGYPDHFVQSLQIVVRPTGNWSKSFPEGFGLIKWSPGNELNPVVVQQGWSLGVAAGMNVGASPSAAVQLNKNKTIGKTFPAFGLKKSSRDGHAVVWEYELLAFEDGSSTQNLGNRRFYTVPMIPEAVRGEVNYPNLGKDASFAGTWMVPYNTADELRNEFEFTISLKAKLPAVWACKKVPLPRLAKPPVPEVKDLEVESDRICVFAIAGLKRFIGQSIGSFRGGVND